MDIERDEILNVFNDIVFNIDHYPIFRNNKNTLIRELNEAIEKFNVELQFRTIISYSKGNDLSRTTIILLNQAKDSYRTILKFIMKISSNDDINEFSNVQMLESFWELFNEFAEKFNEMRNRIDRYKLKLIELKYDKFTRTVEELSDLSVRRAFIRGKQTLNIDRIETISDKYSLINYFVTFPKEIIKEKFATFFFSHNNKYIFDQLFEICLIDSEIKDDIDFIDFTYFDVIKVMSAILYLSIFKLSVNIVKFKENDKAHTYRFEIKENDLVHVLCRISNITKDKINIILKYMIYDSEYHKEKITLIQHLIRINDTIVFSPLLITFADLSVKFYRVLTDTDRLKYETCISKVSHAKEMRMINEIIDNYKNSRDTILKSNFKYKKGTDKRVSAEYDLVFYGKKDKVLLLCECKWFFVGDGEYEHVKLNKKIENTIKERKHKDKYVIENIDDFTLKCFGDIHEVLNVQSMLLSNNYEGDIVSSTDFPVVDFSTFKYVSVKENFDIANIIKSIKTNKYLEMVETSFSDYEFEYHSYKFKLKGMQIINK